MRVRSMLKDSTNSRTACAQQRKTCVQGGRAGAARTDVAGLEHRRRRGARDRAHGRGASLEGLGRLEERKSDDGNRLHVALRTQGKQRLEPVVCKCKGANWPRRLASSSLHASAS